ncbi:hypothetical protein GWK47_007667 [Chionoecetes opilio]|uniref:Uncharacterized protein n=1 Tax=Chionoecetes opilio TaxID=41210 RepID=A0A8J4Y814_CHIOP|nr:hypothetical protein GWK47_007667 [Chionoecetes opilio]
MTLETKEFEITSDDSFCLTDKLVKSHQEIKAQAKVISELQAEVSRLSDQALPQHLCGSSADLSEPLPPPPFHLLQDSEASVVPVEGERWPASDTGTAIKASVNHPDHLQQQQQTEKPNSLGLSQEQSWAPVSPSESEAWSEPDRNVSLARIGLDTSSLGGGLERSTSRPRQHRSTAALTLTSESEAEVTLESCVPPPLPSPVSTGKASKRRSDVAELRRVATKLREVEQLNDTLRAELHIYQTLNQQLLPPPLHTRPSTSDKGVETHRGETADAAVGAEEASPAPGVLTLPASLLEDIRGLRGKLEEAIVNNDQLRDQLESALTAHPQDEARFLHLTAAIQTSQEEQREAREKLQASQITLREQEERCQQLHHKLQQCEAQLTQQQQQLEASQQQATAASIATSHTLQEKESAVKEQAVQLREREQEVKQLQGKVVQLQEEVSKVGRMQEELQVQEARLLEVNKERLTLVGERAKLQAQLVSASAQARLQEPNTSLLQELKAGRCTVATLQKEREVLVVDKEALEKGSQVLRDEVASLQATVTHLKARHTHAATPAPQHPHGDTQHHPQDPHGDQSEHHANDSSQWSGRQTPLRTNSSARMSNTSLW